MRWQTLYEARWIFFILTVIGALTAPLWRWAAAIWSVLVVYVFWFFRDPERETPPDPALVVAAADGKVSDIVEIEETEVLKRRMKRVGIFLSVFDVHTNRAPIDGTVSYSNARVGQFLDARHPEATTLNACRTWAFEGQHTTLVVRQITGAIARRIVAWSRVGDRLAKGERFGMIRFGSRTEVYLPLDATVLVKEGDRVKGGATVIARLS